LPQINVPGIGEVFADGFAEEATMQRILQVLASSDNANSPEAQQRLATAAKSASGSLTLFGRSTSKAGQDVGIAGKTASDGMNMAGNTGRRFSSEMSMASRSLSRSFANMNTAPLSMVSGITDMIKGMDGKLVGAALGAAGGTLLADLFGADGPLGLALGATGGGIAGLVAGGVIGPAAAGLIGFISEKLNATTDAFFKVQQSGAILGGSLIETRVNAHAANLTMSEFGNVMSKNSEAMASFGGQTRRGAREFARANQAVTTTFGQELLGLGIGFEDMGMATAEMMQNFQLSGMSAQDVAVRTDEFAAAVRNNVVQQKAMAAIMGRSVEQQKEAERQQRKDAVVQASLARMQPEQRAEMERLISAFPHLREAILDQAVFGSATSAEALRQFSAFPTAMAGITQAVDNVKSGAGGAADAFILAAKNSDAIREENLQAADMIATLGRFTSNSMIKTMQESFLPMQDLMTRSINKTVVDVTTDLVKASTAQDEATKNMMKLIAANRELGMSFSNATTSMLENAEASILLIGKATTFIADNVNAFAKTVGLTTQTGVGKYNREVTIPGQTPDTVDTAASEDATLGTTTGSTNANTAGAGMTGPATVTNPDSDVILQKILDNNKRQTDLLANIAAQ